MERWSEEYISVCSYVYEIVKSKFIEKAQIPLHTRYFLPLLIIFSCFSLHFRTFAYTIAKIRQRLSRREVSMNFANTLKNLREANNVTQEQLAEHLKVSRPTIAGYETKSRQPDYERLEKIAEYFQVSIDYLIRGFTEEVRIPLKESTLDQEVLISYRKLSLESKQDVLKCIRLLELRDKDNK